MKESLDKKIELGIVTHTNSRQYYWVKVEDLKEKLKELKERLIFRDFEKPTRLSKDVIKDWNKYVEGEINRLFGSLANNKEAPSTHIPIERIEEIIDKEIKACFGSELNKESLNEYYLSLQELKFKLREEVGQNGKD